MTYFLSKNTIDAIALTLRVKLSHHTFTFAETKYTLASESLLNNIEKHLHEKLAALPLNDHQIQFIENNLQLFVDAFVGDFTISATGGNLVTGKNVITSGLCKMYYECMGINLGQFVGTWTSSKNAIMETTSFVLSDNNAYRDAKPCAKNTLTTPQNATSKHMMILLKRTYENLCPFGNLVLEINSLYDYKNEQTHFLRKKMDGFSLMFKQSGDTESWRQAVKDVQTVAQRRYNALDEIQKNDFSEMLDDILKSRINQKPDETELHNIPSSH